MMSYCRFASDSWRSDAYVYRRENQWLVHIAANRYGTTVTSPDISLMLNGTIEADDFASMTSKTIASLMAAPLIPIDHPAAGSTRSFTSPLECADWLEKLASEGFYIPSYVIPTLRSEIRLAA